MDKIDQLNIELTLYSKKNFILIKLYKFRCVSEFLVSDRSYGMLSIVN